MGKGQRAEHTRRVCRRSTRGSAVCARGLIRRRSQSLFSGSDGLLELLDEVAQARGETEETANQRTGLADATSLARDTLVLMRSRSSSAPHELDKVALHAGVAGQLGVEGARE